MIFALLFFLPLVGLGGFMLTSMGLTRASNSVSMAMKSYAVFAAGTLAYLLIGTWVFAAPGTAWSPTSWQAPLLEPSKWPSLILGLLGMNFVGAIVLGGVVGRTRFTPFLITAPLFAALVIPPLERWVHGASVLGFPGGLEAWGFTDKAGASTIHVAGGALALAAAIAAGPRYGKYAADGRPRAIPGSNLPLAAFGAQWSALGLAAYQILACGMATPVAAVHAALSILLCACAGCLAAIVVSRTAVKHPDLTFTMNGMLAGVAAASVSPADLGFGAAALVGALAGALAVLGALWLERKARIDDPTGAISVHLLGGLAGLLTAAFVLPSPPFSRWHWELVQLGGAATSALLPFAIGWGVFTLLRRIDFFRVRPVEEVKGIDLTEHGAEAYHGFQIFDNY